MTDTRTTDEILADFTRAMRALQTSTRDEPRPDTLAIPAYLAPVVEALNAAHERGDQATLDRIHAAIVAEILQDPTGVK